MEQNEHFDDKALARILRRGAEIEVGAGPKEAAPRGYTLAEIEAIAREAGISEDSIRRAASELERQTPEQGTALFGGPLFLEARSTMDRVATDEELDEALDSIPDLTGIQGNGSVRKGRLRWSTTDYAAYRTGREISIDAWGEGGRTELSLRCRLRGAIGGIFGGIVGGLGFGMGSGLCFGLGMAGLHSPALAILFGLGSLAGSWLLARGIFRTIALRARRNLERIASELARIFSTPAKKPE